jgi:hypothetical protein
MSDAQLCPLVVFEFEGFLVLVVSALRRPVQPTMLRMVHGSDLTLWRVDMAALA